MKERRGVRIFILVKYGVAPHENFTFVNKLKILDTECQETFFPLSTHDNLFIQSQEQSEFWLEFCQVKTYL